MALDEEFTLEDRNMLLPYPRDQGNMNSCYSYSTGEAVQALFASTYSLDPFELSTQQIVDHVPIVFDYEGCGRRKDLYGCYYSNHPNVLKYIWLVGLVKDEQYVKRLNRWDQDVLPVPNVTKYTICDYRLVFQTGTPLHLRKAYETEMTVLEINNILRQQPMVGATRAYPSFQEFRGDGVYIGPNADDLVAEQVPPQPHIILHSVLIVGYGIRDGVNYFKIKNSFGIEWGVQGFGKIRRDLMYRLAYPIGPAEIKVEPEKVASSVTVIKNTKSPRIKRHEGRPKTSKSRMQFSSQGKRFGTEATTKRKHPTHERCKTNAVWGVELKPGKPFTHIFEKERGRLHVSQATLSTGSTSMTSIVECQVGDKKSICLCSLLPGKQEKCPLDLEFEEDHEDVTFLVVGSDNVRLSGFFYGERGDFFGDEYGSDRYEEDVVYGARDDSIEFEYATDDEDKDGSGDDDFSMYPPSRVPNSGVKTEEILEEGKPTDESGTIENSTVVKGNTDSPLLESEDEDGFAPRESKSKSVRSKRSDGIEDEDTREEAQNEKARYTAAGERKGLKRKVLDDTSIANDYQRGDNNKKNKKKKVMIDGKELAGAHPGHVEGNDDPTDQDGQKSINEKGSEKMKKKKNASQLEVEKNAGTKPYTMRSIETGSVMEGGDA